MPALLLTLLSNKYVAMLFLCIALFIGGFILGHHKATVACHDRELQAKIQTMQADEREARKASEDALKKLRDLNQRHSEDDEVIKSINEALAKHSKPGCALSDADARRLRGITGE